MTIPLSDAEWRREIREWRKALRETERVRDGWCAEYTRVRNQCDRLCDELVAARNELAQLKLASA